MEFNILYWLLFVIVGVVSHAALPRWGILLTSLLFYALLLGLSIWIPIMLGTGTYFLSRPNSNKWTWIVLLVPLIIQKSLESQSSFQQFDQTFLKESKLNFELIGLSYLTFQCVSFFLDVKKKVIPTPVQPESFFAYLFFFPTIFSGPLHRFEYFKRQWENRHLSVEGFKHLVTLWLVGCLKMLIGQRFFALNKIIEASTIQGPLYLFTGLIFFFALYFSFSAFIDLVRGTSWAFNMTLKQNFTPRIYLAPSRQVFWQGWHKTLNEWFRDYLFFPLMKKDRKRKATSLILLLTFFCIGLWHEFSLRMIIWGLCNGLWIILEKKIFPHAIHWSGWKKRLGIVYHLTLTSFLGLIFSQESLSQLIQRCFTRPIGWNDPLFQTIQPMFFSTLIMCIGMDWIHSKSRQQPIESYIASLSRTRRYLVWLTMASAFGFFGESGTITNLYIQF